MGSNADIVYKVGRFQFAFNLHDRETGHSKNMNNGKKSEEHWLEIELQHPVEFIDK